MKVMLNSMVSRSMARHDPLDHAKLQAGAYFVQTAIDLNLVDQIGSYDQAYQWLLEKIP